MVHHFQCDKPELTLQIDSKKSESDPKKYLPVCVEFVDFDFMTDNDDTAKKIEATNMFKSGQIFRATDSTIRDANRKRGRQPKVVSGSRGTVDEFSEMQKKLAAAEAENDKLKKQLKEAVPA